MMECSLSVLDFTTFSLISFSLIELVSISSGKSFSNSLVSTVVQASEISLSFFA